MKKVSYNERLDSSKLATYLKKKGHETTVVEDAQEVTFHGEEPEAVLVSEVETMTESELDNKQELKASLRINDLLSKHRELVILQSVLDNEILNSEETQEVNDRIAAL